MASLYATLLADARFHELLLAFDADLADAARAGRCRHCDGALHSAKFKRKPRGRGCKLGPEHDQRFSFCCAVDGCRGRETPASLRFLGRRVYVAAIVVLIAILKHGATDARLARLSDVASVDRRTIARWPTGGATRSRRRRSGGSRVPGSCHRSITIDFRWR